RAVTRRDDIRVTRQQVKPNAVMASSAGCAAILIAGAFNDTGADEVAHDALRVALRHADLASQSRYCRVNALAGVVAIVGEREQHELCDRGAAVFVPHALAGAPAHGNPTTRATAWLCSASRCATWETFLLMPRSDRVGGCPLRYSSGTAMGPIPAAPVAFGVAFNISPTRAVRSQTRIQCQHVGQKA